MSLPPNGKITRGNKKREPERTNRKLRITRKKTGEEKINYKKRKERKPSDCFVFIETMIRRCILIVIICNSSKIESLFKSIISIARIELANILYSTS